MGTDLQFSTTYYPQTDGQSERTIAILEDMLYRCVMDFGGSWEEHIPLMEFAYNNSHRSSIDMAPFEALYERRCRSLTCWFEVGKTAILGPDMVQMTTKKIKQIQKRLITAQSRQKSYADFARRIVQFEVGDKVFLRVSPLRGVVRFGKRGKLNPRYIGPYEILDIVGDAAYRLPFLRICLRFTMCSMSPY
ncbi:hypothetical protein Dimus_039667 [Dionaea muscipula]